MGGEGERYGNEKGNRESDQRAEQLQNGVAKLREGSAGDHVADFREAGVGAEAAAGAGKAHRDLSAGPFHPACQRAIVNDFTPNRGEASHAIEGLATNEDAAAGGSSRFCPWIGDPARRVEHKKKVKERRDEEPLGEGARLQEDHEGSEVEMLALSLTNQ